MNNFHEFLLWEKSTRDTIDFKKVYVDMAGELAAGLMLSEIIYWYLPGEHGHNKLKVSHEEQLWIAVARHEWWERARLTPRQADRAIKQLLDKQLIFKDVFKFNGSPTTHVRLNEEHFFALLSELITDPPANPYKGDPVKTILPNGENDITQSVKRKSRKTTKPLTEITTETTTEEELSSDDESISPPIPEPLQETHQELIAIVSRAFSNTNYGYVAKLKKYLVAATTPEDGKYHQWRLDTPMSGAEILGYRLWHDDEERRMLLVAETLQRTIEEFRGLPDYQDYVQRGHAEIAAMRFEARQREAASALPAPESKPAEPTPEAPPVDPAAAQAILDRLAQKLRG